MINGLALCDLHVDRVEGGYIDTSNPREYRVKATGRDGKVTLSAGKPKPYIDRFNLCFFTGTILIEKNTTFVIKNRGLPILLPWTGLHGVDNETSVFLLDEITSYPLEKWIRNWNPDGLDKTNLEFYNKTIKNPIMTLKTNDGNPFLFWSGVNTLGKLLDNLFLTIGELSKTKFIRNFSINNVFIKDNLVFNLKLIYSLNLFITNSKLYFKKISINSLTESFFIYGILNIRCIKSYIFVNEIGYQFQLFGFGQTADNSFILSESTIIINTIKDIKKITTNLLDRIIIFGETLQLVKSSIKIKNQKFMQHIILTLTKLILDSTSRIIINGIKPTRNMESDNLLIPSILLFNDAPLDGASGITIAKDASLVNKGTIRLQGDNICSSYLK